LAELQRTRTSLQYLRSTTQNELKRKDKEVERIIERWNKVSETQAKLSTAPSGLRCANYVTGNEVLARGKGFMEEALEEAEQARGELVRENEGFRAVLLGTANILQGMVYTVKGLTTETHIQEVGSSCFVSSDLQLRRSLHRSLTLLCSHHRRPYCHIQKTRMPESEN